MVIAMNKVSILLFIVALIVIWGMWKQHERIGELNTKNAGLLVELTEQVKINEDYQKRINLLHELDKTHTMDLSNAKAEIDKLRNDVSNGTKRVYVNAKCPKPAANTSESGSNENPARLSEAAEQDYWRLREMMTENEQQTLYLQNYILMECLR